jgi:DNA repair protein RadC
LDTKNRVQKIHTVYIGSLNSSLVRIGDLYKEAIRYSTLPDSNVNHHRRFQRSLMQT